MTEPRWHHAAPERRYMRLLQRDEFRPLWPIAAIRDRLQLTISDLPIDSRSKLLLAAKTRWTAS